MGTTITSDTPDKNDTVTKTSISDGYPMEPEAFVALVGERVRVARLQKGFARRELSERSHVSQRYLAQLESGQGNISIALLYRIANALSLKIEWLVGDEDPWESKMMQFARLYRTATLDQQRRIAHILESEQRSESRAKRICLIGLRGAGKSILGRRLSQTMSVPFVELNHDIEEYGGMPVNEVIAFFGQEGFRQLERQSVERVVDKHNAVVMAASGGIVTQPDTYAYLLAYFHCIWLRASPEEHLQRARGQQGSQPAKAMVELNSILKTRETYYAKAEMIVDISGSSIQQSETALIEAVKTLGIFK